MAGSKGVLGTSPPPFLLTAFLLVTPKRSRLRLTRQRRATSVLPRHVVESSLPSSLGPTKVVELPVIGCAWDKRSALNHSLAVSVTGQSGAWVGTALGRGGQTEEAVDSWRAEPASPAGASTESAGSGPCGQAPGSHLELRRTEAAPWLSPLGLLPVCPLRQSECWALGGPVSTLTGWLEGEQHPSRPGQGGPGSDLWASREQA